MTYCDHRITRKAKDMPDPMSMTNFAMSLTAVDIAPCVLVAGCNGQLHLSAISLRNDLAIRESEQDHQQLALLVD